MVRNTTMHANQTLCMQKTQKLTVLLFGGLKRWPRLEYFGAVNWRVTRVAYTLHQTRGGSSNSQNIWAVTPFREARTVTNANVSTTRGPQIKRASHAHTTSVASPQAQHNNITKHAARPCQTDLPDAQRLTSCIATAWKHIFHALLLKQWYAWLHRSIPNGQSFPR